MTIEREDIERLISRVLDGEASSEEAAQLAALRKADANVRALYDETARLDALVGASLREALDPSASQVIRFPRHRERIARYVVGTIAAAIAALAWLQPFRAPTPSGTPVVQAGMNTSQVLGDVIEPLPSSYETPELRIRGTEREWILIPADQPGLYWVIEADRQRTQIVPLKSDL